MISDIAPLNDIVSRTGESPVWDAEGGCLWWVDIPDGKLYRQSFGRPEIDSWTLPSALGSIGLARDGRILAALANGVHLFDPRTGALELLVDPEPDEPLNRLNDGKVGPDGAFWVGSMRAASGSMEPAGALYRVTADGRAETKLDGLICPNGLAFSADGTSMFLADSRAVWLDRFTLDPATGAMSGRERVATPATMGGRPDGGAFDVEGHYWTAVVSDGELVRFAPDGTISGRYELPVPSPTMPCFGGPDMRTLFVTSLRRPEHTGEISGRLLAMRSAVAGVPVGRFG